MNAKLADVTDRDGHVLAAAIFPNGDRTAKIESYRVAYAGDGAELTGCQVIDEFETMSGPVMICPVSALGSAYDVALTQAFARSDDLEVGSGWPPVIIGLDLAIPVSVASLARADADGIEVFLLDGALQSVAVLVTALDLSVATLGRLASSARSVLRSPLTLVIAVSTATPGAGGRPWSVETDAAVRRALEKAMAD